MSIGLLAAALGLRRDDAAGLARLNGLHFAVRACPEDWEAALLVISTANRLSERQQKETEKKGKAGSSLCDLPPDLQDAGSFWVGLESETALLQELETALKHPVYPLYLGRRSCPPTLPPSLVSGPETAGYPAGRTAAGEQRNGALHIVADADPADAAAVPRRSRCRSVPSTGSTASAQCGSGTQTR